MSRIRSWVRRARRPPSIATGIRWLLLIATCAGVPRMLRAQDANDLRHVQIDLTGGLGVGSRAIAGQASLSVHVPFGEFTLRTAGVSDFAIFGPTDDASDVALLYGLRSVSPHGWVSFGIGPAVVHANTHGRCIGSVNWFGCTEYVWYRPRHTGLALQGTAGWAPLVSLGLGVTVAGDVNAGDSFFAVTLNLHLGILR